MVQKIHLPMQEIQETRVWSLGQEIPSVMSDSLWLHGLQNARLHCSSPTPRACSISCSSSWWCHPTISSSVIPFSSCLIKLIKLITWATALSNSKLWAMPCSATQDGWVIVESSDKTWSTGEGNGKPLHCCCLENPMNSMKRATVYRVAKSLTGPSMHIADVSFRCITNEFSYTYVLFQILFHYRLLQDIEYSYKYEY